MVGIRSFRVVLLAVTPLALAGCGPEQLTASALTERATGYFLATSQCAHDVVASVTETDAEIAIDGVKGTPEDGDCVGSTPIELSQPVGSRRVVVGDEVWERIDDDCEYEEYAPTYAAEEWGWAIPSPCTDSPNG
ncbi:MAG: hypothetical protein RIB65_11290 [Ilumatobacter fluminis]|uniref:hypothetical protein n=1 Tax=Ilumatobacter fluminis TaxID=467091 RepID=UPI0032F04D3F